MPTFFCYAFLYIYDQVTTIQADAADESAISGVCDQAMQEEGRLDVFFANVCSLVKKLSVANHDIPIRLELHLAILYRTHQQRLL